VPTYLRVEKDHVKFFVIWVGAVVVKRGEHMSVATINGVNIYFEIHGNGFPIILIHHGFGCVKIWQDIYPALVEHGYSVIMYDRIGYGKSEAGRNFLEFLVSDNFRSESVRDLQLLVNYLGIDSFHLIGQCDGGVIAVDYAAKFHDHVKSVTTSSTLCFSSTPMIEGNKARFPHVFKDLDQKFKEKLISWHGEMRAEPYYNQLRRYGGVYGRNYFDLRPELSKVICPALVLYPDRSFFFEVEQGVAFYRCLAQGELVVFPKCGHNTYELLPHQYIYQTIAFFERHGF